MSSWCLFQILRDYHLECKHKLVKGVKTNLNNFNKITPLISLLLCSSFWSGCFLKSTNYTFYKRTNIHVVFWHCVLESSSNPTPSGSPDGKGVKTLKTKTWPRRDLCFWNVLPRRLCINWMFSPGWVWCQIQFTKDYLMSENEEDDIERDYNADDGNGPGPDSIHLRRAAARWRHMKRH